MIATILIIGGGQAGAQATDTLRREGFAGRIVLIGDEPWLPYQRPPLSKKYLAGELAEDRLLIRHQSYYDEHRIELKLGRPAIRIDPRRAPGSPGRRRGIGLRPAAAVHRRQIAAVDVSGSGTGRRALLARHRGRGSRFAQGLKSGARVVIIGGGYIGLETAATARQLGCTVTVLEMADRVMNRVVAPSVSEYFAHAAPHARREYRLQYPRGAARGSGTRRARRLRRRQQLRRRTCWWSASAQRPIRTWPAPPGLSATTAWSSINTAAPAMTAIFAAGDCTNHPSPRYGVRVRLESVDNAFEQAKTAALNMLGRPTVHDRVPWFWSDQFDNKLLIVGLSQGYDRQVLRGDPATRSFSVCYLKDGELLALEAVNHSADYMAARKLIAERARLDPRQAGGPEDRLEGSRLMPALVGIAPGANRREPGTPVVAALMAAAVPKPRRQC